MGRRKKKSIRQEYTEGLRHLAFGEIQDAVRLLYAPEEQILPALGEMDLFNISEIKRPKGGGMEIKFFDRLKALEKLQALEAAEGNTAAAFYQALEAGAKCGLFEADEKTAEYYGMPLEEIDWVCVDDDAHYEKVLTYDVSELEPQLSCPQGVDNVHPLHEVLGTPIDEVYLGSCTNGSIEDLAVAAELMKGKHVPDTMRFIVVPATNRVFKEAIERGYIKTFIEAGAVICHPCCGLCCGMPYGLMYDDERILSTANRNFIGRQGTKKTLSYLCSPAVAAATALAGVVSDPRTL